MLNKIAHHRLKNIEVLNKPVPSNLPFVDQELVVPDEILQNTVNQIKCAYKRIAQNQEKEATKQINSDNSDFDLEAEIREHPDSLFVKCFAIEADEPNDNGDYFSREELIKATKTFIGVPIFTNHANNDINQARGKVIHAWWEEEKNGIMIIARIDAAAYPPLARGIREKYIVGTSMGCQVQYSLCSICHNYAETPDDYCSHIKEKKTRTITSNNETCQYHKNGPAEKCPICNCKKGEVKKLSVNQQKVFEYNYGIKFIENSFVVNPACHRCGVTEIIDPEKFVAKVAHIQKVLPRLWKAAQKEGRICVNNYCIKTAGQKELNDLRSAMELLSDVSKSMLTQKSQVDLEFLSDLVQVMADLQEIVDELTQQGYGRLPSPGEQSEENIQDQQNLPATSNIEPKIESQPQLLQSQPNAQLVQPLNPTPAGNSKVQTGTTTTGIGSITAPSSVMAFSKLLKKFAVVKKNTNKLLIY